MNKADVKKGRRVDWMDGALTQLATIKSELPGSWSAKVTRNLITSEKGSNPLDLRAEPFHFILDLVHLDINCKIAFPNWKLKKTKKNDISPPLSSILN